VIVVVDVPKAVVHHGIDDLRVSQAISFSRLRQQIGSVGHRFHSASNHHGTVSGLYCLGRESNCFESGATDFVYGHGTYFRSKASEDCRLPRRILTQSGGDYVPHDAFIDRLGIEISALHRFANHDRAQLRGAQI